MLRLFKRERRAWPRYTGHFDVMYGAHPPLILTTSLDLCEAGMTFRTTQAFPPGTELEVRVLARPEDPEQGWAVTRAVVTRNEDAKMAVRFAKVDASSEKMLQELLAQLEKRIERPAP